MSLLDTLSEREKEVAALLLQGKSNKQIAQALGISTRTVEFHTKHIYEKLGVTSRAEAIIRLSEDHLRETAGQNPVQPAVEMRETTVVTKRDSPENDRKFLSFFRRITMKKVVLAFIVVLSLVCLGLMVFSIMSLFLYRTTRSVMTNNVPQVSQHVVDQPSSSASTQMEGERYTYESISFTLSPDVAMGASGQIVPENPGTPEGPYWEIHPRYTSISLDGYAVQQAAFQPVIAVYPVEDYRRISPQAQKVLTELEDFLDEKPTSVDKIPFLPVINSGQVFHSNVEYLDFQSGSGVRFLTQYAQYPAPVNNQDLFYTFQGLTSDGRYAVSVRLPVNHPALPVSPNAFSQREMEAIAKDAEYYPAQAAALAAQPDSSFTPDLAKLDALIASLFIEP